MAVTQLGIAATRASGWRGKTADAVAPRLARTPLPVGEQQARALVGLAFFALSLKYVLGTLRETVR